MNLLSIRCMTLFSMICVSNGMYIKQRKEIKKKPNIDGWSTSEDNLGLTNTNGTLLNSLLSCRIHI